jgi:hypothetical protein
LFAHPPDKLRPLRSGFPLHHGSHLRYFFTGGYKSQGRKIWSFSEYPSNRQTRNSFGRAKKDTAGRHRRTLTPFRNSGGGRTEMAALELSAGDERRQASSRKWDLAQEASSRRRGGIRA